MATETNVKKQIYQIIESLPGERLPDLLRVLKQFLQLTKSETTTNATSIYQIHQHAVDTGVPDLAAQHDHYLYGTSKHDA
jgi:hypothetical protein